MKDKKKWVIGLLCTLVCVMAVGYAVLAQQLNINGTASIDSTWKVEITNIQESEVVGKATSKVTPSYTSTTANFSVGLTQPGDSITYDVEISNLGTLDAKVDSINVVTDENDAIKYTTSGVVSGDKLGAGEKTTLTIKVEYDSSVTSQPSVTTSDITVTVNYVQDLDEESDDTTIATPQAYVVGDVVSFAGSNWYVIKNSTADEDYVTLMKETVLTNTQLGDYGVNYICSSDDVTSGSYGCIAEGESQKWDTMAYYWSDTCHSSGVYGYTSSNTSECVGHNEYEGSKVKEYLESTYINTLGSDNLKEVNGYKIRLITLDELQNNLGYATELTVSWYDYSQDNTPLWAYQNFGETGINVYGYWTMSQNVNSSREVWSINIKGGLYSNHISYDNGNNSRYQGVRPVINLLKSSI